MKKLILTLLALILIFEEWLWEFLSACGHYLVVLLRLQSLERWLSQSSPQTALVAFVLPILIIVPINFAALHLILIGMLVQAILLEILAKLIGTLIIARIFTLTKSQLLTFGVIRFSYNTIYSWLSWAHAKIVETKIYIYAQQLKTRVKAKLKTIFT